VGQGEGTAVLTSMYHKGIQDSLRLLLPKDYKREKSHIEFCCQTLVAKRSRSAG
jgi:hypothetical protein